MAKESLVSWYYKGHQALDSLDLTRQYIDIVTR
jgi:hypothetical protein